MECGNQQKVSARVIDVGAGVESCKTKKNNKLRRQKHAMMSV